MLLFFDGVVKRMADLGGVAALLGRRVIVYRNLNRGGWSVAEVKGLRGRGLVIGHAEAVALSGCQYVVSEGSRRTVLRTRQRSVHAWIVGTVVAAPTAALEAARQREVTYSPYRAGRFEYRDGSAARDGATILFAVDGKAYEV